MKRGQNTSNVILFLTVLLAALILSLWYISAVRPVRYAMGTVQEDLQEINQHIINACSVTLYNATYVVVSKGTAEANATHLCIYNPAYGECRLLPCAVEPARITFTPNMVLHIDAYEGRVRISPDS